MKFQQANGCTALIAAIENGNYEIVKQLLQQGTDPNSVDKDGEIPLIKAVYKDHKEIAELLVCSGANVNATCRYGTALYNASLQSSLDIVEILLKAGADPNVSDLRFRDTPLIGAPNNTQYAANNKKIAELLLHYGANVNAVGDFGRTALMEASLFGEVEIVNMLVQKGADVNLADYYGETALMLAAQFGYKDIISVLLQHSADIHAVDDKGETALLHAAGRRYIDDIIRSLGGGYKDSVEILLKAGADPNVSGQYGTALIYATECKYQDIVELLLQKGADVNLADSDGKTALAYAIEYKYEPMIELLKQHGAM